MDPSTEDSLTRLRHRFPALLQRVGDRHLAWLDNAATTQKPRCVIDAVTEFYETSNANVRRAVHELGVRATEAYSYARERVAWFLGAASPEEVVFVRGATEGLNLVAETYGRQTLGPGDELLVTEMEHHANLLPWQRVCAQTGATFRALPVTESGELDLARLDEFLNRRTRIVAVTAVSNALGIVNPLGALISAAHDIGAVVVVDGVQALPHMPVNVAQLDCDFFVCSAHKAFGPMGIGALYGKAELLAGMPPWQLGGDMVVEVTLDRAEYEPPPHRFEAGTPNVAGAVGFAKAVDFLHEVGWNLLAAHEEALCAYALERLAAVDGVRVLGPAARRVPVLSFTVDGVHPHDVAQVADAHGVAIRAGKLCAEPLLQALGVGAMCRASLCVYNTREEIDALAEALHTAKRMFS